MLVYLNNLVLLTTKKYKMETSNPKKPTILKLISAGEKIMIEPSDGKELISEAKNTFKYVIYTDFTDSKLNEIGVATPETLFDVYEMVYEMARYATCKQMFIELNSDLDKLVMTQAQIIRFCEKHQIWLRRGAYSTLFLTKAKNEYFVIRLFMVINDLNVTVYNFEHDAFWRAIHHHRVVVPQSEILSV